MIGRHEPAMTGEPGCAGDWRRGVVGSTVRRRPLARPSGLQIRIVEKLGIGFLDRIAEYLVAIFGAALSTIPMGAARTDAICQCDSRAVFQSEPDPHIRRVGRAYRLILLHHVETRDP